MELEFLHWIEGIRNPVLNVIMLFFTRIGEFGAVWIIAALVLLFVMPAKYRKMGLTVAIALLISLVMCNIIMKNMFQRVRPFNTDNTFDEIYNIFKSITDWSFPSGHTSASFCSATAIFVWNKKAGIFAYVIAACIAFSRLYFTVHYPTDVLASLGLGMLYGIAAYMLVKIILKKSDKMSAVFKDGKPYKLLFSKKSENI